MGMQTLKNLIENFHSIDTALYIVQVFKLLTKLDINNSSIKLATCQIWKIGSIFSLTKMFSVFISCFYFQLITKLSHCFHCFLFLKFNPHTFLLSWFANFNDHPRITHFTNDTENTHNDGQNPQSDNPSRKIVKNENFNKTHRTPTIYFVVILQFPLAKLEDNP